MIDNCGTSRGLLTIQSLDNVGQTVIISYSKAWVEGYEAPFGTHLFDLGSGWIGGMLRLGNSKSKTTARALPYNQEFASTGLVRLWMIHSQECNHE